MKHARALIERQRYEAELAVRREKTRVEAETRKLEMERLEKVEAENRAKKNVWTVVGAVVGLAVGGPHGAVIGGVVGRLLGAL